MLIFDAAGIDTFFQIDWSVYSDDEDADAEMLQCLESNRDEPNRLQQIANWLNHYRALQSFTAPQRTTVCQNLVSYHESDRPAHILTIKDVLTQFSALGNFLRRDANLVNTNGGPRDITSLTSKALWCCYPQDAPIIDRFAEASLKVIARSIGLTTVLSDSRYEKFIHLWFNAYVLVKQPIESFAKENGTNSIRVFDRYLWWLGQTSYEGLVTT